MPANSGSGPASRRASNRVVATLMSARLSRWQSSIERTLWPDLQADVPEKGEESLDVRLPIGGVALRQQHHDVDVGAGVQFAAPVAADGDERQIAGEFAGVLHPGGAQRHIDQPRAVAHQIFDGFIRDEAFVRAAPCRGPAPGETRRARIARRSARAGAAVR